MLDPYPGLPRSEVALPSRSSRISSGKITTRVISSSSQWVNFHHHRDRETDPPLRCHDSFANTQVSHRRVDHVVPVRAVTLGHPAGIRALSQGVPANAWAWARLIGLLSVGLTTMVFGQVSMVYGVPFPFVP